MCSIPEAERQVQLAQLFEQEKNLPKAAEHYLEASSIFVLNAEMLRNDNLLQDANKWYAQAAALQGNSINTNLSKRELARRTLEELEKIKGETSKHTLHHLSAMIS